MKQTKMSFYVTLPSHSNRREFPHNQANNFKIRLPKPLQLSGGGWQVGLSAISLPDTGVNIFNLLPADQNVFGTSCYRLTSKAREVRTFNMKMEDLKDDPFHCGWRDLHESLFALGDTTYDHCLPALLWCTGYGQWKEDVYDL